MARLPGAINLIEQAIDDCSLHHLAIAASEREMQGTVEEKPVIAHAITITIDSSRSRTLRTRADADQLIEALVGPSARHSHYADLDTGTRERIAAEVREAARALPGRPLKATKRPRYRREAVEPAIVRPEDGPFSPVRWPRRPYCTDDLGSGLQIRPLRTALERRYLQHNPPHLRSVLVFDIDRPGASYAWRDAGLPAPTWVAESPESGHAHLAYALRAPVLLHADTARKGPMDYLAAVERAYRDRLDADPGYKGLITKNPRHAAWGGIIETDGTLYSLDELAEHVDLTQAPKRREKAAEKASEAYGVGRNCALFDYLRHMAYRLVRAAKEIGDYDRWLMQLNGLALTKNTSFTAPLDGRELWHIVKSVGKWTWRRFDIAASDARFGALQAHRGRKGGLAKGEAYEDKRISARLLKASGCSYQQVADELGVSRRSVITWCK